MNKKMMAHIKNEREIPTDVMEKLVHNREDILNKQIKQEKSAAKLFNKKLLIPLLIVAAALLILAFHPQINTAIKATFGISKDAGVDVVEDSGIATKMNVSSTQNGREIILTKFVATRKKYAFDYQFKLDDEKLKELLEKKSSPDRIFKKSAVNAQDIYLRLLSEGQTEETGGGGMYYSTFRIEGDTFYGSVVASLDQEDIPENKKLILHIDKLAWQDAEELDQAYSEAAKTGSPFSVENALEYQGDWAFEIDYKPLTQKAVPSILHTNKVTEIKANSDALQTTVKFKAPIELSDLTQGISKQYAVTLYKDGVKSQDQLSSETMNPSTGEFELEFSLSALDKSSVYKIQVNEIDVSGEPLEEIGSFELQNR